MGGNFGCTPNRGTNAHSKWCMSAGNGGLLQCKPPSKRLLACKHCDESFVQNFWHICFKQSLLSLFTKNIWDKC